MTTRQLLRWMRVNERRQRGLPSLLVGVLAGLPLAAFVYWRAQASVETGSTAWLAVAIVAFAFAFLRVPFHLYWRSDAALLAQLPIGGGPLFDAALLRCARAALATFVATAIAAVPLALLDAHAVHEATRQITATPFAGDVPALTPLMFFLHHVAIAGVLALAAGLLIPGVVVWAASLLVGGSVADRTSAGTILGAIPGAAGAFIFVGAILASSWLTGDLIDERSGSFLFGVSFASIAAVVAARHAAPRVMDRILRDVSALDRQRLAHLDVRPPTALERAVAALLGDAALPYRKDARLMRRRYPMAFALGAVAFITLAIMGLAHAARPWLVVVAGAAALYAATLASRLSHPPIELPRLSSTLPITAAARRRAKLAWIVSWSLVFVGAPLAFALLRAS
ncbi:MAG: hypothetical protein JO257_13600 [Deltaproteobacteria bacterium]|nr:hypothetical protein [Deltaproteobacteria bacterium]